MDHQRNFSLLGVSRSRRKNKSAERTLRPSKLSFEALEQRQLLSVDPVISEFMASNSTTLADYYGNYPDWLEIHNPDTSSVNMAGWKLKNNNTVWTIPDNVTIPSQGYLKIFCDNRDTIAPNGELHTNFKLGSSGDYLGLLKPDNAVVSEYAPEYPQQYTDVSYGLALDSGSTPIISTGSAVKVLVPTTANGGSTLSSTWQGANEPFADSGWTAGTKSVGMVSTVTPIASSALKLRLNADSSAGIVTDTSGSGYNGTNSGAAWVASAVDTETESLTRAGVMQFSAASNSQVTVASNSVLCNSGNSGMQGAVSFWMQSSGTYGTDGDGAVLVSYRSSRGMLITQTNAGQIRARFYQDGNAVNDILSAGTVSDGQWHNVTVAFSQNGGSSCAIYIDGVLDNQAANGSSWSITTAQPLEIGRSTADHTPALTLKNYNGLIDDFRYYTSALTAGQILGISQGADESVSSSDAGVNVQSQMLNVNSSAFMRYAFTVADYTAIENLMLTVRHNDGFVAWLNGYKIASENAPDTPAWNSVATAVHSPGRTWKCLFEDLTDDYGNPLLHNGTNILAIQGLNLSAADPNFLVIPQLTANVESIYGTLGRYFVTPTPGAANGSGTADLGPIVSDVTGPTFQPGAGNSIPITAKITQTVNPIQSGSVILHYRVMYNAEVALTMYDDGTHGDGASGDGIYGATIPAGVATAGKMLRWYVSVTDTLSLPGRWPVLAPVLGNDGGPEYEGTVIANPSLTSTLPIIETFAATTSLMDDWGGTRGSVFYLGEFYDNVFMRRRGGYSTLGNKIEFNSGYDFKFAEGQARVSEINMNQHVLIGDKNDPSYTRPTIAYETYEEAGCIANIAFPIRVQRNGSYSNVSTFVEQTNDDFLKRNGIYEEGAIYKNYDGSMSAVGQFEKKNRDEETNTNDLQALIDGLHLADPIAREKFIFDNIDIPAVIDYIVAGVLTGNNDQAGKNFYIYRDTNDGSNANYGYANAKGTNEWALAPWDEDLTFGKNWALTDYAYAAADPMGHPFFSDSEHPKNDGPVHWMTDVVLDVPEIKQMFLRRLRTVMDELLQPPGTPAGDRFYEQRLDELFYRLKGDSSLVGQVGLSALTTYINDIKTKYLDPRRTHLYVDHSLNTSYNDYAGIPAKQEENLIVNFGAYEVSPASGIQDQEYLTLVNPSNTAIDISGWKLTGGIDLTFKKGVVIPASGTLYVSPNVYLFRQRTTGPAGNQGLLVEGNYSGSLSKRGDTVRLLDGKDNLLATLTTSSSPSLAQQYLRITEVMYHPADPPSGNYASEDFQYIELKNTSATQTLSLTGVQFTQGVVFSFTGSSVTTLAPGARVLVVSNLAAFQSRYGTTHNAVIAGQFAKERSTDLSATRLANGGEKITLVDSVGETILSFSYEDDWYKQTDGAGNSLVIRDAATADLDLWDRREGWFASHAANGSPNADETADYAVDAIVVNEVLSHTDIANPGDWVEFYNTTASPINIGGWYLSNKGSDLKKYRIADDTIIPANGYVTFNHHDHFGNSSDAGFITEFSFDEFGETVYLTSASGGTLTTYQTSEKFDANDRDRDGTYPYHQNASVTFSYVRYIKSTGGKDFVETQQSTYNGANSEPRVGPVVINEINYHPSIGNVSYIELKNITSQTVYLYDPDHYDPLNPTKRNTWRLSGGVDFDFPQGASIAANGYALVVNTDPTWFRWKYGIDASVPIYGAYWNELGNDGDTIVLERAGEPQTAPDMRVPYYPVDKVTYEDGGLWPKAADGLGASLNRITASAYGNDVANWTAGRPTPGVDYAAFIVNPITLTSPAASNPASNKTANLSVQADSVYGATSLIYNWSVTSMPAGATYPTFSVNNSNTAQNSVVTFGKAGDYTLTATITDLYGSSITSSVNITVSQTITGLFVTPAALTLAPLGQQQFTAFYADQFGHRMNSRPASVTWSATSGTITTGGLYTAPSSATTATITLASSGYTSKTASVTVGNPQGYWKFDESTGSTAADSSGNGYTATIYGSSSHTAGLFGNGLFFNGTSTYVSAPINVSETSAAISFWFKTTSESVGLFQVTDGSGSQDRCLALSGGRLVSYLYNWEYLSAGNQYLSDGQWHHVVYTYGGSAGAERLYIDGVQRAYGTRSTSDFNWDTKVYLGYSANSSQPYFQGTMDEFRIYSTGLTAASVAYLASVAPTNINLSNNVVPENTPAALVGNLSTIDVNAHDNYTYLLQSDPSGKFEIVNATLKLKAGQSLDFEANPSVNLTVRVYNSAGQYFDKAFTVSATDLPETMIALPADWPTSGLLGMTLKLDKDGKLHLYRTGTTTDLVPPHLSTNVTGISVTGRNTNDILTIDSMSTGIAVFTLDTATANVIRDNAITPGAKVIVNGGILDFNGHANSIGDLTITANGAVVLPMINNTNTTVRSGTLTVESLICDTLIIGSTTGAAAVSKPADITESAVEREIASNAGSSLETEIVAVSSSTAILMDSAPFEERPNVVESAYAEPASFSEGMSPLIINDGFGVENVSLENSKIINKINSSVSLSQQISVEEASPPLFAMHAEWSIWGYAERQKTAMKDEEPIALPTALQRVIAGDRDGHSATRLDIDLFSHLNQKRKSEATYERAVDAVFDLEITESDLDEFTLSGISRIS